jgi:hypothetical protein
MSSGAHERVFGKANIIDRLLEPTHHIIRNQHRFVSM